MKISNLRHSALCVWMAAALLAGCGGSQTSIVPKQTPLLMQKNESGSLAYIASEECGGFSMTCVAVVSVYTFPQGEYQGEWVGSHLPWSYISGECAGPTGKVFATYSAGLSASIIGFAHGGTSPILGLSDPSGLGPLNCSIDPMTGNLAVTSINFGGTTSLLIYPLASGNPISYTIAGLSLSGVGYDNKGNVFVDGTNASGQFGFAELTKGSSSFKTIILNQRIQTAGNVQWDGKHMAVTDSAVGRIYQFDISGTLGTKVGTTELSGIGKGPLQDWIQGAVVLTAKACNPCEVQVWNYPVGGPPIAHIGDFSLGKLSGVTISI